jgi:hypothetical protein
VQGVLLGVGSSLARAPGAAVGRTALARAMIEAVQRTNTVKVSHRGGEGRGAAGHRHEKVDLLVFRKRMASFAAVTRGTTPSRPTPIMSHVVSDPGGADGVGVGRSCP